MIAADDLVALVRNYNPKTNEALIRAAYDYGREMHEGQFRHSGEPYFSHPVAVAAIRGALVARVTSILRGPRRFANIKIRRE